MASDEAKAAAAIESPNVEPCELILAGFSWPKLLSELPVSVATPLSRSYWVFTSMRLVIPSRDGTLETSFLSSPSPDIRDEIGLFWERTRAPITPNTNVITVRAIEAVIQAGAVISIPYEGMDLVAKMQPLSRFGRLTFSNLVMHLEISGKFISGEETSDATVTIKPDEPLNEIERVLRLLPIKARHWIDDPLR